MGTEPAGLCNVDSMRDFRYTALSQHEISDKVSAANVDLTTRLIRLDDHCRGADNVLSVSRIMLPPWW